MWVDESGGTDTEAGASADAVTVHVDGEEYQAELNYDLDKDGVNDAAVIQHDDGTGQAFVDTDGDGEADQYAVLDENGKVVQEAVYDEASGAWVEAGGSDDSGSDAGTSGTMHADMPSGDVEVGAPTIDTDGDGTPDTAVIQTEDGRTIAFTDKDGDGKADIAVETDASGNSKTYEHTGPGQWTETGSGVVNEDIGSAFASAPAAVGDPAGDAAWGGAGTETLEGVAKIDSATGQWISPN
ncbi:DUF6802 family protein [Amycolatopsis sp. NPDC051071]|uniref:DUF6802 family protein n=1 Tax=Amycolatopsis sp. NPDC051071 TaxID=3154637 RepID=UPI00343AA865